MTQTDIRNAQRTTLEAMHCLTVTLIQLLKITVHQRQNTNYQEELRLFSALCSMQANMGQNLLFIIDGTEKTLFKMNIDKFKNMIHQTNQFFEGAPKEFKLHPLTEHSMRQIIMWRDGKNSAATSDHAISKMSGFPSPPWFNQQFTNEKGEINE